MQKVSLPKMVLCLVSAVLAILLTIETGCAQEAGKAVVNFMKGGKSFSSVSWSGM